MRSVKRLQDVEFCGILYIVNFPREDGTDGIVFKREAYVRNVLHGNRILYDHNAGAQAHGVQRYGGHSLR